MLKRLICTASAFTLILCVALLASPVSCQGSAENAISQTKNTLKDCYLALSEAETAGANVDSLQVTLNQAAESLSIAELAYSGGNYTQAFSSANDAQSKLSGFEPQAAALRQSASASTSQNELLKVLSLAGSIAVLLIGISVWVVLNRGERRSSHASTTI